MPILADPAAERAVLAGICKYGSECYLDIVDMLRPSSFTVDSNQILFKCLQQAIEIQNPDIKQVDLPTILSSAQACGLTTFMQRKEELAHLRGILAFPVHMENVRSFAAKISKLEVTRTLRRQCDEIKDKLIEVTGEESVTQILGIAEDCLYDFSSLINDTDNQPLSMGNDLEAYLTHLGENPVTQLGIPTGFPRYDASIGGGLRDSTINVIAARAKVGKTMLTDNIGYYIAETQGLPVLNLDTEMTLEDHQHRTTAMVSGVSINEIETGQFYTNADKKDRVFEAANKIKNIPYYYKDIPGRPFEEQLAIMRRWLTKTVGLKPDGTANKCVIIYDYLKLMDTQGISKEMAEWQLLGFMMTSLHNFAARYKVPMIVLMQLNRDGITKEDTSAASGSDRIIWLCSNFTIFKFKSDEEIAEDGPDAGNRKLLPIVTRHGPGIDFGNYINCHSKAWCAEIKEGKSKFELDKEKDKKDGGFVVEDGNDDTIDFNDGDDTIQ